ncbi:MAG TPA: GntR family transcriptional regulator [Phycisphaerales bacterium]|nr:GntR family transcriptional regulator [Phycisphaerales bacterium]HCD31195.1 GntR family transcriptional regulator [Phycisphaerales bacterium]|tara:strand:- start:4599 stop:6053 length:1455 start_codon:yes stop_codon:yes gene_type:complete
MSKPNGQSNDGLLYEQVARQVSELIRSGTLLPGERVPSVRQLCKQLSVSVSTVMQAYRILEDQQLIRAVPQSGYFVREPKQSIQVPTASRNTPHPKALDAISLSARIVEDMNRQGTLQLGAALPDNQLLPLDKINRLFNHVTREYGSQVHEYAIPPGRPELRRQIAKRLIDSGCSINPDNILVTTGATEAISLSLRAVTKPGDVVAIESPTFFFFLDMIRSMGLKVQEIATAADTGMNLEALEKAMKQKQIRVILLVSNFPNPLGTLMPLGNKRRLVELARQYNVTVIEDDIYGDLSFDGSRPTSIRAFDDGNTVITLGSFSKTISPGLRVGWCVPGEHMAAVMDLKLTTDHASATLPQLLVATYLEQHGYDRHLRGLRKKYKAQVDQFRQAIARYFPPGTRITKPKGGYIIWVEMSVKVDAIKLHEDAVQQGISIAPGQMFSAFGRYKNCMRINCGLVWSEQIEAAIKTLGELVKKQLRSDRI